MPTRKHKNLKNIGSSPIKKAKIPKKNELLTGKRVVQNGKTAAEPKRRVNALATAGKKETTEIRLMKLALASHVRSFAVY